MAQEGSSNDIELDDLKQGLRSGIDRFKLFVFRSMRFLVKRLYTLAILLLVGLGFGLGWQYVSKTTQRVDLLVKINAGSTAFVYQSLEDFNVDNDFPKVQSVKISPVVDLAEILERFKVLDDEQIMMLLDEVNSSKPLLESEALRSNYELHQIEVVMDQNAHINDATKILDLVSTSTYYEKTLSELQKSNALELASNSFAVEQIDSMLVNINRSLKNDKPGTTYTNYENFDLASLLRVKDSILIKNQKLRVQSRVGNCLVCIVNNPKLKGNKSFFNYKAIWLPILLIVVYLLYSILFRFYQKNASRIDE